MNTIYMAGPMKGLSYKEANSWRRYLSNQLEPDIKCLNPFRGKEDYLSDEIVLGVEYNLHSLSNGKAITTRDRFDAQRCNLLVVNFLGAKEISIGTVMEIAWADSKRIPILLIIEDGNPHNHPMITEVAGFKVNNLDDAISLINAIL